jgi:amino acid transporter
MPRAPVPPEDRRPALRPPQFGLSTLLWIVAFFCAALAAMKFVGPLGAFALVLLVLSVLAHISGNALGTRLRACGDQPVDEQDRPIPSSVRFDRNELSLPGPRRLTQRQRLGILLTLIVLVAIGAGVAGGVWWTLHSEANPTSQDIGLAAIAFGVLGGIWGFIGGGFVVVGAGAIREAMQGARGAVRE